MKELTIFEFQGNNLRVIEHKGGLWFIGNEVCKALGIVNSWDAIGRLSYHQKDDLGIPDAIGRIQKTNIISEGGLYKLAFRSHKEEAETFTDLVADVILPSIRKTGSYSTNQEEHLRAQLGTMQFFGQAFKVLFKAISAKDIVENKQLALGALSMLKHVRLLVYRAVRDYEALVRHFHGNAYNKHASGDIAQFQIVVNNGELVAQLQFPLVEE
jgi:prophage antirepressor-like protein